MLGGRRGTGNNPGALEVRVLPVGFSYCQAIEALDGKRIVRQRSVLVVAIKNAIMIMIMIGWPLVATGSSVPLSAAPGPERGIRHHYRLAGGVKLVTIRHRGTPNEVRVLTLTQGHGPVADVLPAGARYPAVGLPSTLAWASGAIAAVNDDFSVDGRPKHLSLIDGEIWTTGTQPRGPAFGFSQDVSRAFVGTPRPLIEALPSGHPAFVIHRWNAGKPRSDQVAGFSRRGGSVEHPPGNDRPGSPRWCAVRLVPRGPIGWVGPRHDRLGRSYVVESQPEPCPTTPLKAGTVNGSVVLAARPPDAETSILPRATGDHVRLRWSLQGWPGVVDVIGGTPLLVEDGVSVGPAFEPGDPYLFNRNPRTAVGIGEGCQDGRKTTICKVFIVTVDGRQESWSRGMRFPELGRLLIRLGAVDAVNLDGGGSTETWIRKRRAGYCESKTEVGGCLANRPSEGRERPAVMSLALLPEPDRADPRL